MKKIGFLSILILISVSAVLFAGCISSNASPESTTDAQFKSTVDEALQKTSNLLAEQNQALKNKDYASIKSSTENLSAECTKYIEKISPMTVSNSSQLSKKYFLQYLIDCKGMSDAMIRGINAQEAYKIAQSQKEFDNSSKYSTAAMRDLKDFMSEWQK